MITSFRKILVILPLLGGLGAQAQGPAEPMSKKAAQRWLRQFRQVDVIHAINSGKILSTKQAGLLSTSSREVDDPSRAHDLSPQR